MTTADSISDQRQEVLAMGRLPPPVTGMTLFTEKVVDAMRSAGTVDFVNWSVGAKRRTSFTRLRYIAKSIRSLLHLLGHGRVRQRRLYLMVNSDAGLYFTALLAAVAARLGYCVYLHHHVYNYIERHDRRMAWIVRRIGPTSVHVVACRRMMQDFCRQYPNDQSFAVLRPSAVQVALGASRTAPHQPFRLGLLSNLSAAKGLRQAIETFVTLHSSQRRVTLTLAGPALDKDAQRLIEQTVSAYPTIVVYLGPVYDDAKTRFFRDLDAFLFPTQRESWGIVLHESLAAGVPVIANDRGCISVVVGETAGRIVPPGADFAATAAAQVCEWIDQPHDYVAASAAAIQQADFLNREGQRTLEQFAAHMFAPPGAADGLIQSR